MCTKGIHSRVLINTLHQSLDRHLNPYLINILIDTQWTLYRLLINSGSTVGWMSTHLYMNQSKKKPMECWWSVNWGVDGVSIEYRSRVPRWTSRSILNQHPDRYSIDTLSKLIIINSRLIVGWVSTNLYESIENLFNSRPRCWWSVDGVSTEVLMECQLSIDQGSVEGIDQWRIQTLS